MLGLRLDEPLLLGPVASAVDERALERMERLGLARVSRQSGVETVLLTRRGRFLGGGVTAEILM